MSGGRERISVRPLGTSKALTLAMPPDAHHTRQRFDWIAEMARGEDAESMLGWSWLLRDRLTGKYFELEVDARCARSLPQREVTAALKEAGL